jgi:putative PIN family toxin of toxin-antitoxin system
MRKRVRIILDTNVLYSGLYSSNGASFRVLQAIDKNRVKMVLSTTLLFEYEDVLKRELSILGLSDRDVDKLLDYLCLQAEHQKIHFLWRPRLPDPKDDHILELAVASQTSLIVTHNIKDFRGSELFGVRSITPKKLLEEIL